MSENAAGMAEAVERRRLELGLTIGDLAEAAGLTRQGLDPVRKGEVRQYNDRTIMGVARALRWQTDWYERLVAGVEPQEVAPEPHEPVDPADSWDVIKTSLSAEDQAAVRQILEGLRAKNQR